MKTIKINFVDFWAGFVKDNNYFYNVLSTQYNVVLDDDPDYLFYSSYGNQYLHYKCTRIFYASENVRPDFYACDYAFTFDFIDRKNHFRFPLYGYYIDMYPKQLNKDVSNLFKTRSREELALAWYNKKNFCCIIVSNPRGKERIDFFKKLNKLKGVDSGGRYLNNVGGAVPDKLEFIKDYRFVISFENSSYPGYTTEKIMEPIVADCIPIYWGNPKIALDFNEQRFLNYPAFSDEDALIERILELENSPEKAIDMVLQPAFPGGTERPVFIRDNEVLSFFETIVQEQPLRRPVAVTYKRYIHWGKITAIKSYSMFKRIRRKIKR